MFKATKSQLAGEEYTRQINPSFSVLQCLLDFFTMSKQPIHLWLWYWLQYLLSSKESNAFFVILNQQVSKHENPTMNFFFLISVNWFLLLISMNLSFWGVFFLYIQNNWQLRPSFCKFQHFKIWRIIPYFYYTIDNAHSSLD